MCAILQSVAQYYWFTIKGHRYDKNNLFANDNLYKYKFNFLMPARGCKIVGLNALLLYYCTTKRLSDRQLLRLKIREIKV